MDAFRTQGININPITEVLMKQGQARRERAAQQQQQEQDKLNKSEAMYLSAMLRAGDDIEKRNAFIQDGYSKGLFDDDDLELFSTERADNLDGMIVDKMKIDGYKDLLPEQYRDTNIKSPTTNKTIVYKDGTYQAIMNDGSRKVFDAEDNLLSGPEAKTAINNGVNSGIQFEGDKAAEVVGRQEQTKMNAKSRNEYIKQGRAAMEMMPKTKELLRLNELIESGGFAANAKAVSDWLGVTDADQGLFNAKAGKLILDNIRALGANPTEGERAFLEKITPSIRQGKAVNKAILEDMYEVQKRQVERARWLANNPGSTVDDYFFMEGVGDFSTSSKNYDTPQAEEQPAQPQAQAKTSAPQQQLTAKQQLEQYKAERNGQTKPTRNRRGR